MAMQQVIIFLGAPGSGKGTQAKRLSAHLKIPHISTGDLLREQVAAETEIGKKLKNLMEAGKIPSDEMILDIFYERINRADCTSGYILDGFPRRLSQAEKIEGSVTALYLDVPAASIVDRIVGRRCCPNCGQMYHVKFSPPAQEGICDACETKLILREDDTEEVVKTRLAVYDEETSPLIDFYNAKGVLKTIQGTGSPDTIFANILTEHFS